MPTLTTEDRLDLHDVIARSSQAIDFSNPEAYADCFTSDGVMLGEESPRCGGLVKYRVAGHQQLRKFAADAAAKRQGFGRHWISNTILKAEDGGASGISYLLFLTIDPETVACRIMVSAVHYDRYARTDTGWKISERVVRYDG